MSATKRLLSTAEAPLGILARGLATVPGTTRLVHDLQAHGELVRNRARIHVSQLLDRLVPVLVAAVLQRTDLTTIVHERVDIDQIVKDVDVDAVASRLDLDAVMGRLDLTRIVLERVDLSLVVQEVLDQVDLVGIAEYIVDAIDLPQIIRDSSGALASDTIRGVRLRGAAGDRAIRRARDRVLHHRGGAADGWPDPGVAASPPEPS